LENADDFPKVPSDSLTKPGTNAKGPPGNPKLTKSWFMVNGSWLMVDDS